MSVYFMLTLSALWLFLEIRLLVRDRNLGKGSTGADHRTRNLNTAATIIALTVPPGAALLRWFAPFAVPWKGLLWAGLVVSILGTALRHWSIAVLGRHFRTTIEVERNQEVVQSGPYRFVRHPAYTGIIVFFLGYGLMAGNWMALLLAVVPPAAALIRRIGFEEVELEKAMGERYREYKKRTKKLIPGIY